MNTSGLIQNQNIPEEQKKEHWRKAGKKGAEANKKNYEVRNVINHILNSRLSVKESQKLLKQFDNLQDDETSYKAAIVIKQLEKALRGDTTSFRALLDYGGEKPKEEVETEVKIPIFNISEKKTDDIEKEFEKYK